MSEELGDRIMEILDEDDYPTASLTADVVILKLVRAVTYVLLIERGAEPFKGKLALPGGFVDARNDEQGEKPEDAARREMYEETGVVAGTVKLVGVYADPGRDPRGRVVTFAYSHWSIAGSLPKLEAGDDAVQALWIPIAVAQAQELAFDHSQILREAVEQYAGVWS